MPNIKGGANTVTVTFNQSVASPDVRILEYSGLSTSSPLDVTAAATGSSTSASSGSATTSSAAELIFGANTVYTGTKSAGSGFTSRIITPDGDLAEDENVSTTGSYSATATLSSTGNWVMQMATFKAATTTGTSVYFDGSYAPFGEAYAGSGTADLSFTGQNQDTVGGMYDFLLREYHPVQGRWISPDPAGMAAASPMNPQSWNRYAYVGGNPLAYIDPLGLDPTCTTVSGVQICDPGTTITVSASDPGGVPISDVESILDQWGGGGGAMNGAPPVAPPPPCAGGGAMRMASCAGVAAKTAIFRVAHTPWYKNSCITSALGEEALHVGIDAVGLIPEAGGVARMIGHGAGYVGVVADQLGTKVIQGVGGSASAVQGLAGLGDTSPEGLVSTGLTVAGFIPGLGQAAAVGSIGVDVYKTVKRIGQCH